MGFLFISSCLVLLYILFRAVIQPLRRMNFYKAQGVPLFYFPLIGVFFLMGKSFQQHKDFHYYNKHKARTKPAKFLCTNMGSGAVVYLYDPVLIKEFCLAQENYVKDSWFLGLFETMLGKGLITSEGNDWKVQRRILSKAFHFELMKSTLPRIQATAHKNFLSLKSKSLQDVDILSELQKTTGQVIGKLFFGEQLDECQFEGRHLTLGLTRLMIDIAEMNKSPERVLLGTWFVKLGLFKKHRALMGRMREFRNICHSIVTKRKTERKMRKEDKVEAPDMLDLLLDSADGETSMSDDVIVDQFISFFVAGMDTTSHLINMVIYYLDRYPEYRNKILDEIKRYYRPDQTVTIEDLNKLEFTMAFIKETLRVMTPVSSLGPRIAIKDHEIGSLKIRKGDGVNFENFYNQYNPQYFKDVDDFNPNRWFEKDTPSETFAFIPFSSGPRSCIGQHLSLNESRIILAELLTMYDFRIKPGFDLKMNYRFIYEPVDPILLTLAPLK